MKLYNYRDMYVTIYFKEVILKLLQKIAILTLR